MESSSCVSETTPEEEMAVIREIIDSSESRVKEGDSFYVITLRQDKLSRYLSFSLIPYFLSAFHFSVFRISSIHVRLFISHGS